MLLNPFLGIDKKDDKKRIRKVNKKRFCAYIENMPKQCKLIIEFQSGFIKY